jgi:hypothetical protein
LFGWQPARHRRLYQSGYADRKDLDNIGRGARRAIIRDTTSPVELGNMRHSVNA